MKNRRQRAKIVRRRKVAALAAYSRQFTVHNTKKGISPKVDHKLYYGDLENAITCPFTGHKFVPTNPHPIPGKFGITITGYDWEEPEGMLWKPEKHPQPKRLIKCKKRKYTGEKWTVNGVGGWMRVYDTKRHKRNDFVKFFPNYPYNLPKMNQTEYWEALVQHKLAKWERKNPCPAEKDDLFKEDYVDPWVIERNMAEERIRDFVVSVYDKLPIMGNRVDYKNHKMKAEKIAEIKDIGGKGHDVSYPNLSADDKLYKEASKKARNAMQMDAAILDADLINHKRNQKRPLDAKRSKTVTLADKKLKKAA